MTDLAFMHFADWAGGGKGQAAGGARIRAWLDGGPDLYVVSDLHSYATDEPTDVQIIESIAGGEPAHPGDYDVLHELAQYRSIGDRSVAVICPNGEDDFERLRSVVESEAFARIFVFLYDRRELVAHWIESQGATDLHTNATRPLPDPLLVKAAARMVAEEYNGLRSGRGKDAVVQLLRAFESEGYAINESTWLTAYFAAGGAYRHAETVQRFVREIQKGASHRVKPAFKPEIVSILREQLAEDASEPVVES